MIHTGLPPIPANAEAGGGFRSSPHGRTPASPSMPSIMSPAAGRQMAERASDTPRAGREGGTGRLVVVSNRVPVPTKRGASGPGGLAVALEAALKEHGGLWFGWSGDARPAIDADAIERHQAGRITFAVTDLTKRDVDEYYLGFSNRALWPVCHYRLDYAHFSDRETAAYWRVNDLLARKLCQVGS